MIIFKLECLMYLKATLLWQELVFLCRIHVLYLKLLGASKSNSRRLKPWKNGVRVPAPCVYNKEVTRIIRTRRRSPTRNILDANLRAFSLDCTVHHCLLNSRAPNLAIRHKALCEV